MKAYHSNGNARRLGRMCLAAMVLLFALSGCAGWKVRDEGFSDNDLSQSIRKARPQKNQTDYGSLSEKGRQIERDLNAL